MKKILVALVTILLAASAVAQSTREKIEKNGSKYVKSSNKDIEMVYYCTGSKAYAFHLFRDCKGLAQCKKEIVSMAQKEAQEKGRKRCGWCWSRLQHEKEN